MSLILTVLVPVSKLLSALVCLILQQSSSLRKGLAETLARLYSCCATNAIGACTPPSLSASLNSPAALLRLYEDEKICGRPLP